MKRKAMSMIAATLTIAMLAGCGNSGSTGGGSAAETGNVQAVASEGSGNFNEFGWEIPEETLVINILDASGNYAPNEAQKVGEQT